MQSFRPWSILSLVATLALFCVGCGQQNTSPHASTSSTTHEEYGSIDHDIVVSSHDVYVYQRSNQSASLGHGFPVCLSVEAQCAAANVVITTEFDEEAATYMKSEPEGRVEGNKVIWEFDYMRQGDCQDMTVWFNAKSTGDIVACTSLEVIPIGCICVFCGCPELYIEKCGPAKAMLGQQVCYQILVRNDGDQDAKDVCLKDEVPEGLRHCTGKDSIAYNIGTLCPGECRQVPLKFEAVKLGEWCNKATAKACNCPPVSAEACTKIICHNIDVSKSGPAKQFAGKVANYHITVRNTGNEGLTGVYVVDTAPNGTCIESAPGATICGNTATWNVGDLAEGESKSFNLNLCNDCCGTVTCNVVEAGCCEGCCDEACAQTEWVGHSALLIEVTDCEDPLLVGCTTTWNVRVANQGTASDHNVQIVAKFPEGLKPHGADGTTCGSVDGQMVIFDAIPELCCKEYAEWTICAEAVSTGDQRVTVELTSDLLKVPVVEEESTHVY